MDAATAAFIASCKDKEGATKKLPTIFKYNGTGNDVYVCGKGFKIYGRRPIHNCVILPFNKALGIKTLLFVFFMIGSFNNWQKLKMSRSTKDFVAIVDLKEGEHEYKFLVDGEWINDPNEPKVNATDQNGYTVQNNLIRVQKEDFDAYHALDMDSKAVALAQLRR